MHENRRQKLQNIVDHAESKRSDLQAKRENASSAKAKNDYINDEVDIVKESYKNQIKLAKSEKDTLEVVRLRAEKEKEIRDLKIEQHQNSIDELENHLDLLSAQKENARTADEKIELTDQELAKTKEIYAEKKAIAELEGNIKEADRLDEEYKAKEKQAQIDKADYIKDEYDTKLNALERDKSDTDARIKKNEALGLGQSRKDYKEQIEQSKNRRKILEDERESLERYLAEYIAEQSSLGNIVDENDSVYRTLRDSISECGTGISDCITEQIEFNKAIDNMDLENYKSLIDLLEKGNNIYKRFKSLAEVHGSTLSDDDLFEQIGINDKIIIGYEGSNAELAKDIKRKLMNPEILGLAEEQADKIVDIAKNSPKNLAAYMESLGIKDFNEQHFPELFENINKLHDNIDTMYEKRVENENLIDDYLDNHISKINDYLDALKKEKDIKDRTLAIEKAQYELNKAKNNLTKKVWDGSQWVYTSDTDAVQSAQEAFDNAQYDELVNVLEDLVEALEKFKTEDLNLYDDYGNQINTLDEVKEMAKSNLEPVDVVDLLRDKGIDVSTFEWDKAIANLQQQPFTYDIPKFETPNFNNTSNHNAMNVGKIENYFPNVTNESAARDLMEDFMKQMFTSFSTYARQYDWNK